MTDNTDLNRKYQEAIRKLADGYADRFADFCAADERVHELLMDLAAVFVTEELPIVSEDSQIDMAAELIMSVTIRPV
jgi:hypothetical protein